MQNRKLIIGLSILVILVGAAAFVAGRMLNNRVNPLSLFGFGGKGGMMTVSVQMTPAKELPTTKPDVTGLFAERKDQSIVVASVSMEGGGGGVVVQTGEGGGPAMSTGPSSDGPKVEVVITGDTTIYLDTTQPPSEPPTSGETQVVQQTVGEGSLDDLTSQSFVTVWGRKSGDRIIAEVVFISNPVMFKRP
jgi:hypothetical protein